MAADGFITDLKRKFQQGDIVLRLVYVFCQWVLFHLQADKHMFQNGFTLSLTRSSSTLNLKDTRNYMASENVFSVAKKLKL